METLGKENLLSFNHLSFGSQSSKPPGMTSLPPSEMQRSKFKPKPAKTTNSNVRAGDWVCLMCNNLNFSFRDECNRCQGQTKKQNYIQNLQLASESQKLTATGSQDRTPFKDLTNYSKASGDAEFHEPTFGSLFPPQKDTRSRLETEISTRLRSFTERFDFEDRNDFNYSPNCGFENVLLVAPPRGEGSREILEDYLDSNESELPPYQSPKKLPSVSPILKKVILDSLDKEDKSAISITKKKLSFSDMVSNLSTTLGDSPIDSGINVYSPPGLCPLNKSGSEDRTPSEKCVDFILSELSLDEEMNSNSFSLSKDFGKYSPEIPANPWAYANGESGQEGHRKMKIVKQDWVCSSCGNLNYSFRKCCNRCQRQK